MRALIVEDDERLRLLVRRALEAEHADVIEAGDVADGIKAVQTHPLDVVLVDLTLPSGSGYDLLPEIEAADPSIHVIMVTGAGREADRVRGLRAGADDYIVKPFSLPELVARVAAGHRRRIKERSSAVEVGPLRVDPHARLATLDGMPLDLTRRELDLLHHLACSAGKVFSREDLLKAVWGSSAEWQSPTTVTEHIRRLRSKIEVDPRRPQLLQTVRGVGYRLIGG